MHITSDYVDFVDAVDYCGGVTMGNFGLRIGERTVESPSSNGGRFVGRELTSDVIHLAKLSDLRLLPTLTNPVSSYTVMKYHHRLPSIR